MIEWCEVESRLGRFPDRQFRGILFATGIILLLVPALAKFQHDALVFFRGEKAYAVAEEETGYGTAVDGQAMPAVAPSGSVEPLGVGWRQR